MKKITTFLVLFLLKTLGSAQNTDADLRKKADALAQEIHHCRYTRRCAVAFAEKKWKMYRFVLRGGDFDYVRAKKRRFRCTFYVHLCAFGFAKNGRSFKTHGRLFDRLG